MTAECCSMLMPSGETLKHASLLFMSNECKELVTAQSFLSKYNFSSYFIYRLKDLNASESARLAVFPPLR